ncbi:MAG: ComF family protein [Rickettsiales bacterium]|jgi:predicted amidophosphoribosyltransferase|nr:ComF family protein [Rickettsiales bacterium]
MNWLIDFIFPPLCPMCGRPVDRHGLMCAECWNRFDWITDPMCEKCGYPFPADTGVGLLCPECAKKKKTPLDWMRAAAVYDGASRNAMLPFKHGGRLEFRDFMSNAMKNILRDFPAPACGGGKDSLGERGSGSQTQTRANPSESWVGADLLLLPVPLAFRRLWHRGYNQAALLAKPLARALGCDIDYDSVKRKYRKDMGHKNAKERAANIRGVFSVVKPEHIRGRRILLVDDVFTTGATFNELAKVLKKSGALWVGGITFCRTVKAI